MAHLYVLSNGAVLQTAFCPCRVKRYVGTKLRNEVSFIAIYHYSIKIISRAKGKSSVAAAAYRAGETIRNENDGCLHDYSRKKGIVYTKVLLPKHAPLEYANRATLWNAVEKCERYKTAQLAREIEIALPVELSRVQNLSLVRSYVQEIFVDAGMCADVCLHDNGDGNPHAHIMLTVRPIEKDGTWGQKSHTVNGQKIPTVDWNKYDKVEEWRFEWASFTNRFLQSAAHSEQLDHRSYERQGIEQIPTIHMGSAAWRMEQRGITTERGNKNRKIISMNQELRRLRARIGKLQKWIDAETKSDEQSANLSKLLTSNNLLSLLSNILESGESKSRRKKVIDLQTAAKAWAFLQDNRITTLSELGTKVTSMRGALNDIRDKVKPIERRLGTLNEHFVQVEIYRAHNALYKQYMKTNPKQQASFYEQHRAEIALHESAQKYLNTLLNGRKKIPLATWKAEAKELATELKYLYMELDRQKDEVRKVEIIQRGMTQLVREATHESQRAPTNREADLH